MYLLHIIYDLWWGSILSSVKESEEKESAPILTLTHLKCYALKMKMYIAVNKSPHDLKTLIQSNSAINEHQLNMDTSLLWTVCLNVLRRGKKACTFSLNQPA